MKKINAKEKARIKKEIKARIEEESWVTEFVHIIQTVKIGFDYQSEDKTREAVEVLEEAKGQIRCLQADLLRGLPDAIMFEMQLGGQKGYNRETPPVGEDWR